MRQSRVQTIQTSSPAGTCPVDGRRTGTARRAVTRTTAALLLAATVTGLTAGAASAAAAPVAPVTAPPMPAAVTDTTDTTDDTADGEMRLMSSRRITVTNMSGDTMRLASVDGDKSFEGRPEDGSLIEPGREHAWELTYLYARTNADTVKYDLIKPDGTVDGSVTLDLRVTSNGVWSPSISATCISIASAEGVQCAASGDQVTVIDAPGTQRTIDGSGPNKAAATILRQVCESDVGATCTFDAKREVSRLGAPRQVGAKLANPTDILQSKSVAISDAVQATDTVGGSISVSVGLSKIVEASVEANYSHSWSKSHTFTETMPVNVPAKQWGWIETRTSYFEHTGDFVIKLGNTTWTITDVTLASPNPKGETVYVTRNAAMTQEEIDDVTGWTPGTQTLTAFSLAGQE